MCGSFFLPEELNAVMRNVFSYCFRKPSRVGVREEEIESEATIYLVQKGLRRFREAVVLECTIPPPHADLSFIGKVISRTAGSHVCVWEGMGLHGLKWNSGSAQGPLAIVGAFGGLHFTLGFCREALTLIFKMWPMLLWRWGAMESCSKKERGWPGSAVAGCATLRCFSFWRQRWGQKWVSHIGWVGPMTWPMPPKLQTHFPPLGLAARHMGC